MLRNSRIYLKRRIDESTVLDESGEGGLTELKQFVVSLINFLFHTSFNSKDPKWVIHHIDKQRENNYLENIALMTAKAHQAFHSTAKYYTDYPEDINGLRDWLGDIEKAGDKKGYLNQVIILEDVLTQGKLKLSYAAFGTNKSKSKLTKNPNNNLLKARGNTHGNRGANKADNSALSENKSQQQ